MKVVGEPCCQRLLGIGRSGSRERLFTCASSVEKCYSSRALEPNIIKSTTIIKCVIVVCSFMITIYVGLTHWSKVVMGRVLGIGIENRNYRNLFWYGNRRILIKFPILKTILWNLYVCNLNFYYR